MRFLPAYPRPQRRAQSTEKVTGAIDFLQSHNKMAHLLPTVSRLLALQKDCAAILPAMFNTCQVLNLEAGQLVIATPNAALASKLKHQLPKIQADLLKLGWQVNAIRLKVQAPIHDVVSPSIEKRHFSEQAKTAFITLSTELGDSPQNAALKDAVLSLIKHHSKNQP
jgi:hypothetical protein